ncbi:MAG: 16S rRNA methyltransferase [Caldilineaceae bacterium]|nr:16S rRNA methyltransferase [Caldilineaceae bacterium]
MNTIDSVVGAVQASAKYRTVAPELIRAIAGAELSNRRSVKAAVKATKNKLHQVVGAYQGSDRAYDRWLAQLARAREQGADLRPVCRQLMGNHASTRERLSTLDQFYDVLFSDLPPVTSVLDLACGLNPLALPWMPLAPGARYYACDVDAAQIHFLAGWLQLAGFAGGAFTCNLLDGAPGQAVDVALLLKTIPCLEQLDKAIGPRLLPAINAAALIVSFPGHSLGGRSKGMVDSYGSHFASLVAGQPWQVDRFEFPGELVFRIRK